MHRRPILYKEVFAGRQDSLFPACFQGRILVLIVPVPGHRLSFTI